MREGVVQPDDSVKMNFSLRSQNFPEWSFPTVAETASPILEDAFQYYIEKLD